MSRNCPATPAAIFTHTRKCCIPLLQLHSLTMFWGSQLICNPSPPWDPPAPTPHSPALIADTPHKTDADCTPPKKQCFSHPSHTNSIHSLSPCPTFSSFFPSVIPPLLSIWACISYPVGTEVSLQSARPPFLSIHPLLPTPPPLYSLCLADFFFCLYSRNAEDILLWIGSGKKLPSNRISSRSKEGRKNRGAGCKRTRHCAT